MYRHCLPHLHCTGQEWIASRIAQFSRLPLSELVEELADTDQFILELESRTNTTGIEYAKKYRDALMRSRLG